MLSIATFDTFSMKTGTDMLMIISRICFKKHSAMWRKTCEARAEWYYSDCTHGAEEKQQPKRNDEHREGEKKHISEKIKTQRRMNSPREEREAQ